MPATKSSAHANPPPVPNRTGLKPTGTFFSDGPTLQRKTMNFQDNLSTMPDISHLSGFDVLDAQGVRYCTTSPPYKANWVRSNSTTHWRRNSTTASTPPPPNAACPCLPNIPPMRGPIRANIRTSTCCSRSKQKIWYCNCALSKPDLDLHYLRGRLKTYFQTACFQNALH